MLNLHRKFFFLLTFASALHAAPRLKLFDTSLNVSVAQGVNGAAQTINAFNTGDGRLNLQASSSVPWLVPTVGPAQSCALVGLCTPVRIALNTSSLPKGFYRGTITISDPNAIDAPQLVSVTVAVGGNVPDKLDFYVNPGNSSSSSFITGGPVNASSSNVPWLSLNADIAPLNPTTVV